jgi:hypothetical protein
MTPDEAYADIVAKLRTALHKPGGSGKLRVLDGPAGAADRGTVVVGPPRFGWEGQCDPINPTSLVTEIYLIEQFDERAIERLLKNLPELLVAVAGVNDATITAADPGSYPASGADLPCYRLTAEMDI